MCFFYPFAEYLAQSDPPRRTVRESQKFERGSSRFRTASNEAKSDTKKKVKQ